MRATHSTCPPYTSVTCPTDPHTISILAEIVPFQGHLNSCSCRLDSLSGRVGQALSILSYGEPMGTKVQSSIPFLPPKQSQISKQLTAFTLKSYSAYFAMSSRIFSEMSTDFQGTTLRHIRKAVLVHNHRCDNLKSYITLFTLLCHTSSPRDIALTSLYRKC
jgi:hypothetical protein